MLKSIRQKLTGSEYVIAHKFRKPPWGGGNQFLLALKKEFHRRALDVGANTYGKRTRYVLINSHSFDIEKIRRQKQAGLKVVHRVDGPATAYGRTENNPDLEVARLNQEFADATIFQSQYSLQKNLELGFQFKNPVVIHNAVDRDIFYPPTSRVQLKGRKIKLVASAWSNNPKKGAAVYEWLDQNLDFNRYEFLFVGRVNATFKNFRVLPPVDSEKMAEILREQDIYIFASQFDACSNALLEALNSGLPCVYHASGGSPELVKGGGAAFTEAAEIPALLEKIASHYDETRAAIQVDSLAQVADKYLDVFTRLR